MKKLALILGVLTISGSVLAQEQSNVKQSDLKGPAYKNYQIWSDKSEPVKIYSQIKIKSLEGPAYKNQQQLKNSPKEDLVLVSTSSNERQKLTGPAYKNYGPWSKNFK
ncbi:hypothetical protein ACFQZF_09555 [Flavobacterium myungsuense]|uniref:Uncharacterized protein n=1 Tax=Flavobacterium myungsuense TaxID=651823 RepID=A0ABW3J4F8_9FLAO